MCGILGIFDAHSLSPQELRRLALQQSRLLRHRGPDWSGIYTYHQGEQGQDVEEAPHILPSPDPVTIATGSINMATSAATGTKTKPPSKSAPKQQQQSKSKSNSSDSDTSSSQSHENAKAEADADATATTSDDNAAHVTTSAAIAHERLAIIDPESGSQPLFSSDESLVLAVNGEIYNHEDIRKEMPTYKFRTKSDCEVLLPLYERHGADFVNRLDGMFAFILWNKNTKSFFAARDHIGIVPLYIGWRADGGVVISSEMKALHAICANFQVFPPGHYFESTLAESNNVKADGPVVTAPVTAPKGAGAFRRWYEPIWMSPSFVPNEQLVYSELRTRFERAVVKRMMTDVPWGVLLSGGLDSSLVASVATRAAARKASAWPRIHSFSVGLDGSPDLAAARRVAEHLGTKHHEFTFTVQEGLDAVNDVIYALETYDTTTIRAATPMYLMSRKIKAGGVKMVLSGEGADEAMAGYLYFHKAPNKEALHKETVDKLSMLHYYDCLRANKAMSAFGVEPRVPFLDRDFLDYVMKLDPEWKLCKMRAGDEKRGTVEKFIMRKAFDTPEDPYLPEDVLWRQKEQFSDGVGYSWIDSLRARADGMVSARQWQNRARRFPVNTPPTKEAYVYREIFESNFPGESARDTVPGGPSVACSTPAAIEWDESFKKLAGSTGGECSGRAVAGVHNAEYHDIEGVVSGKEKARGEAITNHDSTSTTEATTALPSGPPAKRSKVKG